jgi:starch phosphorylase
MRQRDTIAYFSMEVALDPAMPTYSGGLGILAGDTLRAAADLGVPMVGVTLLHRKGYLRQQLDASGLQTEAPAEWPVEQFLTELPFHISVNVERRTVNVRAWKRDVIGVGGAVVPVLFLDTDLPGNTPADRTITHHLYGGDLRYRLAQEVVLGIGGVRMLRVIGYETDRVRRYHMNEGHAALLGLELLREEAAGDGRAAITHDDVEAVRRVCVFTTHTPVPAGHDRFPLDLVRGVLDPQAFAPDLDWEGIVVHDGLFNMTLMALSLSRYVNGVAKRHAEVARLMFAHYVIDAITNGVHAATWVSPPLAAMLDRHIPDWRQDNFSLRYAHALPSDEIRDAHAKAKGSLLELVRERTGVAMQPNVLTIGFARRATAYKRADLIFQDTARLLTIARDLGPLQFVFGGKAHPKDADGKHVIQSIFRAGAAVAERVKVAYVPDYDMASAKRIVSGVDVWLNTPEPPLEASGTSGMKAALNGVPSLSIPDGWWIEGCVEGVTGWAIGADGHRAAAAGTPEQTRDRARDAQLLYDKLERAVVPTFYKSPEQFVDIMRHCIGLNGSFFNTHRMLQQYVTRAYFG